MCKTASDKRICQQTQIQRINTYKINSWIVRIGHQILTLLIKTNLLFSQTNI